MKIKAKLLTIKPLPSQIIMTHFLEKKVCARHCSKHIAGVYSFNPFKGLLSGVLSLSSLYSRGKGSTDKPMCT